ncbi:MAG: sulfatase-like hydrolase/transferase [Acidobacteria bacterium]|nr:sulfatase-like hydrolase/transferase [Acidobacteriota bacterium]
MTRRAFVSALSLFPLACGSSPQAEAPTAEKPNFVVLLVDDWGWSDAGCLGSDLYQTPNIDALTAQSMRFANAYSACTVCSPTRAALMTGKYPARTHVTDFIRGHSFPHAKLSPPDWTMKIEQRHTTLAEALGAAGYHTAIVGKWHLEPTGEPDEDDYRPEKHGFEINVGGNEWGAPATYFYPYAKEGSPRVMGPLPPGGKEGDYLTDVLTEAAVEILGDWGDQPFFLYFPYYTVHTPIEAKAELEARFQPLVKDGMRHQDAAYAAMLASLDESVGKLRAQLERMGVADRTVILLAGDNGGLDQKGTGRPTENSPLREGKGSAYEGGVRVPTVIHWPGVTQPGALSQEPVITVDLYPTVLDIAGVEGDPAHNAEVDGVSLTPLLRDPSASLDREALYWHYPHYHNGGATPHSAIRAGDWRLVEFYEDGHAELYNLAEDVGETKDLAAAMPDKTAELQAKLHAWREKVGAQPPVPNPNYQPKR